MIVTAPDAPQHIVDDYDFTFTNGMMLQITIDREAGDEIDFTFNPTAVIVKMVEKPNPFDPDTKLPSEEITLYTSHILTIQKRTRSVTLTTPEQQLEWKQTLQSLSKTVQ